MPSPFPGMDPYIENPVLWPGMHQRLVTYLGDALNRELPPGFVADIGERIYVVDPRRSIYPDVSIFERVSPPLRGGGGAAGRAPESAPPWVLDFAPAEVREVLVKILPVGDVDRVVTVIEVLSPANKMPESPGRELYLRKQLEVLRSDTHRVEIDLVRTGAHTVAAPLTLLHERGLWAYLVCRHLGGTGEHYELWPIHLKEHLPRIRIPLADELPDVELDLQALFTRCDEEGAYARRLDYRQDPVVPLKPEDAAWADALLRQAGLRE